MTALSKEEQGLAQSLAELSPNKISQVLATANNLKRSTAQKKKNALDPKVKRELLKKLKAAAKGRVAKLPFSITGYIAVRLGWTEEWSYGCGASETHINSCRSKIIDREEAHDLIATHFAEMCDEPRTLQKEIAEGQERLAFLWEELQAAASEVRMDPQLLAEMLIEEANIVSVYDYDAL